ncbi:serine/threonine-protein kinase [Pseudactinotalea sp. Z1739]|uniref:serine/threonine-protein kinase n=1 Tax=Pseudactinotalea sp. Z1739 TaxID=3413028 RepID=UPI003C7A5F7D
MAKSKQPAPEIEGYTYVRTIGRGGFSDVFLYTQHMPHREVAIKVLRTDALTDSLRRQFAAEANLMARLSNHINIASIYDADIDDEGEPYLVMEYCSGGSLGDTYRHYPMSVQDVLRIGVRLSGALEAAHRAGIVHRDIKPGNILLTEYGVPVLSDFGISTIDEEFPEATMARARVYSYESSGTDADSDAAIGLSLPWAAPETLGDPPVSDTRSDRYSLAATLYSLLEGRSPHEIPGGPNSASHLTGRIQSGFVAGMQRPDLPDSLVAVLRRAMSFDRAARYPDSYAFGQALREIQRELGHDLTPLDLPRGHEPAATPPDPAHKVAPPNPADVVSLPAGHPTLVPPEQAPPPPRAGAHTPAPAPVPSPPPARTSAPATASTALPANAAPGGRHRRRRLPAVLAGAAVILALVITGGIWLLNRPATYEGPAVEHLTVTEDGGRIQVAIPQDLAPPEEVQTRVVRHGLGPAVEEGAVVSLSLGHTSWIPGYEVSLDPDASEERHRDVTLSAAEIEELLGEPVVGRSVDSVLLVAAPRGYFPDEAPDLRIDYPYSQLAALRITGSR